MTSTSSKFFKLDFKPGFHRETTQYAESGSWFDGDRVRFRRGKPENLRGYQKEHAIPFDDHSQKHRTLVDMDSKLHKEINSNQHDNDDFEANGCVQS